MDHAQARPSVVHMRDQPETDRRHPPVAPTTFWHQAAQFATIGIFLIMFGAFLDLARAVVLPIVSAAMVGTMLGPLGRLAARRRVPAWVFALAAVGFFLLLAQVIAAMVMAPLIDWIGRMPELAGTLRSKLEAIERGIAMFQSLQSVFGHVNSGLSIDIAALLQPTVAFLTPTIGELLIFLTTLFFVLLDRADLRKAIILLFEEQDDRLRVIRIMNDLERHLSRYIGTVTVINLAIGVITTLGAWAVGLPNPVVFGALAYVCNYVPYIGPAVVVVVLFAAGLVSFPSLAHASLAPLLFVGLATIEGHLVTPNIVGRRLTLSPLAVFLSLAFWTWLWGPVGAFLSVPFLILGLVIVRHLFGVEEGELPE